MARDLARTLLGTARRAADIPWLPAGCRPLHAHAPLSSAIGDRIGAMTARAGGSCAARLLASITLNPTTASNAESIKTNRREDIGQIISCARVSQSRATI